MSQYAIKEGMPVSVLLNSPDGVPRWERGYEFVRSRNDGTVVVKRIDFGHTVTFMHDQVRRQEGK